MELTEKMIGAPRAFLPGLELDANNLEATISLTIVVTPNGTAGKMLLQPSVSRVALFRPIMMLPSCMAAMMSAGAITPTLPFTIHFDAPSAMVFLFMEKRCATEKGFSSQCVSCIVALNFLKMPRGLR